jgi:hypothetical protein
MIPTYREWLSEQLGYPATGLDEDSNSLAIYRAIYHKEPS